MMSIARIIIIFVSISAGFAFFQKPNAEEFSIRIIYVARKWYDPKYIGNSTYLRYTRESKTESYMKGCMVFLIETGPVTASMNVSKKDSSGVYKNYNTGVPPFGKVNSDPILGPFFALYNATYADKKNCIFNAQKTCLTKIDMEAKLQEGMQIAARLRVEKGCFKVFLHYDLPGKKHFLIHEIIIEIYDKTKGNKASTC